MAQLEVQKDQDATQDLLHQIEFGSYEDRRRYVTRLANIRKHRRKYKDFIEINSELYKYFKDPDSYVLDNFTITLDNTFIEQWENGENLYFFTRSRSWLIQ